MNALQVFYSSSLLSLRWSNFMETLNIITLTNLVVVLCTAEIRFQWLIEKIRCSLNRERWFAIFIRGVSFQTCTCSGTRSTGKRSGVLSWCPRGGTGRRAQTPPTEREKPSLNRPFLISTGIPSCDPVLFLRKFSHWISKFLSRTLLLIN